MGPPTRARWRPSSARVACGARPGQLLEILADVDTLGIGVVTGDVPPDVLLALWERSRANRANRTVQAAIRRYLGAHGAELLCKAALARRSRGGPLTHGGRRGRVRVCE